MIYIGYADASQKSQLYDLWQECFHDPEAFADYYFETVASRNKIIYLKDNEKLCAMAHLNPYTLYVDGHYAPSAYIVGVATHPEERHKGYMRAILGKAAEDLYQERMPFVYLMPASPDIYRPFGFEYIYQQFVIEKNPGRQKRPPHDLAVITSKPASIKDLTAVILFANQCLMARYEVFAYRDQAYYEKLLAEVEAEQGEFILIYRDVRLIGYVAYGKDDGVEIKECLYAPEEDKHVLRWLTNHFKNQKAKILTLPLSMSVSIKEPDFWNSYYKPIIMGRIIHVEAFMALVSVPEAFNLMVRVLDPWITSNQDYYNWSAQGFIRQPQPLLSEAEKAEAAVITITGLMSWIFGEKTPKMLVEDGVLKATPAQLSELQKAELLDEVFLNEIV